jgi:hypothetical protein
MLSVVDVGGCWRVVAEASACIGGLRRLSDAASKIERNIIKMQLDFQIILTA